jgi:membrane protease YdiL (CAAX protease family)
MAIAETAPARTPARPFSWRLFGILLALIIIGLIGVLPYALTLQAPMLARVPLPFSLPVLALISVIQGTLIYGLLAAIGLLLANRIGLGAPILEAWLNGEPVRERLKVIVRPAIITGMLAGVVIIALIVFVFNPLLQAEFARLGVPLPAVPNPPAWQGLLASFYGAFDEEILLRLFMLTLLAWLGSRISRTADGRPTLVVLWVANILAAVLFGVGHLPTVTAMGLPMTGLLVTQIIVLNGLAGLAFGWLYWRYGLESAMLAHFSADIVLHVIAPLVLAS